MNIKTMRDCSKCLYSKSYGSKDTPTIECNSTKYDIRMKFKEKGKYYAASCPSFKEKGLIRDGFIMDNYLNIILGGNSKFILHSTKTNEDYEYRLKRVDSIYEDIEYLYYLNIKYGTIDTYAGSIYYDTTLRGFKFSQGEKGNVDSSDISVRSLLHVVNKLINHKEVQYLQVLHTGTCSVCAKELTTEDEIRSGVHDKCLSSIDYPEILTEF